MFCADGKSVPDDDVALIPELSSLATITEAELRKIIMSSNSKSCHLDPLPTSLLKECLDCLIPTLTRIVNLSIASHSFPLNLKSATVVPLLKKPSLDSNDLKNYRPVSNLPYISKIIEKCVVKQLNTHLSENALHPPLQSAYRQHHSTETAIVKVVNDVLCAMDSKKCVLLVMLDLSAAFDTVDHEVLFHRLNHSFGITGSALKWLQSYFSDRSQCVNINGTSSSPKPLGCGLPQGSVIGPFDFPPYIAPVFAIAKKHGISIHMYADDTQLYFEFDVREEHAARLKMEACILEIRHWMSNNFLKLNEAKTEYMVIGSQHLASQLQTVSEITIGDAVIPAASSAKNIGAVIDKRLSMVQQISNVCRSCYIQLRDISQIRPYITQDYAAILVHSLVVSKLDGMNSILCGIPEYLIQRLQLVQNNAARLVTCTKKHDSIRHHLLHLHWLPVQYRIKYKILLLTYKSIHGQGPSYIRDMLHPYVPCRTLRSSEQNLLIEPHMRLKTIGDRAFSASAPRLWNKLPESLRSCAALDTFKGLLKTHLFKEAVKSQYFD